MNPTTILVFIFGLALLCRLSIGDDRRPCKDDNTKQCGETYSRKYSKSIARLHDLEVKTDAALDSIMRVALVNMRARGEIFWADADEIEYMWATRWKGELLKENSRDIGHIYLIKWLEDAYQKIEGALGVEVCKALHLSDIKTVNCFLGIVGKLCTYDMTGVLESRKQDVRDHLAKGAVYYGIGPVVTWWTISIGCWAGTAGVGSFICAIAASGAEWLIGNVLMPPISDRIYDAVCGS